MKRVRRRFGRIISCVLTFVLLSGQAAGISSAYASVPDDSRVPEVQTSPYSSSETSPTVVRELVEERSEAGRQFLLSDGTIRAEYFGEPIHYRDKRSGAMERIETTLVEASADGRPVSVNRANRFRLQLPGDLQEDQVSVAIGEAVVALRPAWRNRPGAADPGAGKLPATAESPTERSYPRAFSDATLKFESRADGVKETIVVPERSSANVYGFDLELTGLTPRLEDDGSISLRASGEATPTLTMPAPCMWDSAETTTGPAFSDKVHYELSRAGSVWRLDVVIDSAWLDDPQRAYPVYVDPTLYTSATPLDTYVSSNSPSTNYSGSNRIWVNTGNPAAYWWEYGYIQFPTSLVSDLATKKASGYGAIYSVMSLFHDSTAVLGTVTATRVTSTTNISTVTWTTRPTGTVSIAGCYPAYIEVNDWNGWDITDAVKIWQQNATSSCTVAISASAGAHLAFKSVQFNQQKPLVEVYYAPTPTVARTSPTSGSTTTLPAATWTYSCVDAQTNWELEVREGSTSGPLVGTKSGTGTATTTTLPTPTGGWKVGTAYYVRMRAASTATINGIKMWSAWTSWGSFTPALPAAPTVTRTSPTTGDVTVLPNATWTYSSAFAQANWELEVREGSTDGTLVGTASGTGSSTRDSALPTPSGGWLVGTTYYVRIRAAHAATCSFGSPPFWSAWTTYGSFRPTLPPPPTVVLVSPSSGDVSTVPTATWTYTCADTQTHWELEVATTPSGTPVATASGSGAATSAALPTPSGGWQAGTTYHVRVRAGSSPAGAFSSPVWSAWTAPGTFVPVPPSQVGTAAVVTTASAEWFLEEDADANGIGDAPNDSPDSGRGSVALVWGQVAGAASYRVYLFDGNVYRQVASTTAPSWSSAGAGIFPSDSAIAALSNGTTGDPFLAGTGLDLRDDPRPLYAKTAGSTMDGVSAYAFKIVPYGTFGQANLEQATEVLVALDSRTVGVNPAIQHSEASIGEYAEHRVEAVLDTASMRVEISDLVIASYGPPARLSRAYDSSRPDEGLFGPGWRFNFEQAIEATSSEAVFVDETGDAHRFYLRDGVYHAPAGYDAELTREFLPPGVELGYRLSFRGGNSMLFNESGVLCEERDTNDNAVYYDRTLADQLSIWAANGQRIVVDFDASRVSTATYTTTDGTRQVLYSETTYPQYTSAKNTCTYYPGTDDERTVLYDYGITFMPGTYYLTDIEVAEESSADWHFEAWPRPDDWYQNGLQVGHIEWDAGRAATVVHLGRVYPEDYNGMLRTETYTEFQWNPTGTLVRRSNPYAFDDPVRWRSFAYTADGDIARETDPLGHIRTWGYDARGNVLAEADEEGRRTTFAYGTSGGALDRVIQETAPSGSATYRTYDDSGNVLNEEKVLNAAGERARTSWSYDEQGRTVREEKAISVEESVTTTFSSFAPCGEPGTVSHLGVALSSGAATVTISEHTSYDAFGNVSTRTDATGIVTETNTYSDAGRLTESLDASGTAQASTYDALGRVTESWREAGGEVAEKVAYVYDALGSLAREDHYDGETVAFTVTHTTDALGRTLSSEHSISGKTTRWYDAAGNVAVEWVPGVDQPSDDFGAEAEIVKKATRTRYDALGRSTATIAPGNPDDKASTTTYSAAGDVSRVEAADGSWNAYAYDGVGNRISETRPTENGGPAVTDTYSYDLAGRLVESVKAAGTAKQAATSFTYDLLGRQEYAQLGAPSSKAYNALSWVLSETDFDGIATARVYDATGRITSESIEGKTTTSAYDGLGRTVARTDPAERTVRYEYDAFGRTASEAHEVAGSEVKRTETGYDSLSRSIATTQSPAGVTSSLAYAGGSTKVSTATVEHDGLTTTISYSALGRETTRSVTGNGASLDGAISERDTEGRRKSWTVAGLAAGATYDATGKLLSGDEPGIDAVYGYDPGSSRKTEETITVAGGAGPVTSAYTYTETGRLSGATIGSTTWDYTFDERGNLTGIDSGGVETSFTVDSADRLTGSIRGGTSTTYTCDDLGRRRSATVDGGPATTYTFDDASRLTGWQQGTSSAVYAYDANGQRTSATLAEGSVTTTTTYTYNGITLLALSAARSDNATWTIAYLHGEDGRPYAGVYSGSDVASEVTFLIATTDRGDVVGLTDILGTSFARYTYDPYGAVLLQDTNAVGAITAQLAGAIAARQPLRYASYVYDAHSATYYLSQRHYDPATARFLTKDPARDDGEESAYQYCAGDPVGKVDPSGLATAFIQGAVVYVLDTFFYFADGSRKFKIEVDMTWAFGGNTTGYLRGVTVTTYARVYVTRIAGAQGRRIHVRTQKYVWRDSTKKMASLIQMGVLTQHTSNSTRYSSTYMYDWLFGVKLSARADTPLASYKTLGWVRYPKMFRARGTYPSSWP